mgnify:CR=1 FL=1
MLITLMLITAMNSFIYSYDSWSSYKIVTKVAVDLDPSFTQGQIEKSIAKLSDSESDKFVKIYLDAASFELELYHKMLVGNGTSAVERYFYLMLLTGLSLFVSIGVWIYVARQQKNSNK